MRSILVDQLIEKFQNEIIGIFRFQDSHSAAIQIAPGHFCLFIEQGRDSAWGIIRRFHAGIVGKGKKEAMRNGLALYQTGHILHALLDHFPASLIALLFQALLKHFPVAVQIKFLCQHIDLQAIRRDFQIGGKVSDCVAFLHV